VAGWLANKGTDNLFLFLLKCLRIIDANEVRCVTGASSEGRIIDTRGTIIIKYETILKMAKVLI
jgi:hypothetical protein